MFVHRNTKREQSEGEGNERTVRALRVAQRRRYAPDSGRHDRFGATATGSCKVELWESMAWSTRQKSPQCGANHKAEVAHVVVLLLRLDLAVEEVERSARPRGSQGGVSTYRIPDR